LKALAGTRALFAVGVSLGGNALLKWLGEQGPSAGSLLRAAVAISAPVDLAAAGDGLARASNTTPVIVLRFEADNPQALSRIQAAFRQALSPLKPDAALPF